MPHKRNPILTENLSGLARLIRGYAVSAMENVALWHERDISHSSVERVIAPDACIALDFMLQRFTGVIDGLVVYPDRMRANLELTRGLVFSGTLLIALVDKGMTREAAYQKVQQHALAAWEGGADLKERFRGDAEVGKYLNTQDLEAVFDVPVHVSAVLGRTRMDVGQLLKLGPGTMLELDRKVGEAIDIFVNNRLVARGEVVLVEDRLGVTMTEIIKADRT